MSVGVGCEWQCECLLDCCASGEANGTHPQAVPAPASACYATASAANAVAGLRMQQQRTETHCRSLWLREVCIIPCIRRLNASACSQRNSHLVALDHHQESILCGFTPDQALL